MIPIFLHYNNYYNRTIKRFETADEYMAAAGDENYFVVETDTNWQFNDGIYTTYDFNDTLDSGDFVYDYMLLCEKDADYTINSRWFVVESTYNRRGQHKLTLRRDVVADNYSNVLAAPTFIEKATATLDDPAIYNSENMTFNQIKRGEYQLKDNTLCPWVAVYMAKKDPDADTALPTSFTVPEVPLTVDYTLGNWDAYEYNEYRGSPFYGTYSSLRFGIQLRSPYTNSAMIFYWDQNGKYVAEESKNDGVGIAWNGLTATEIKEVTSGTDWEDISYDYTSANKESTVNTVFEENGKIVKIGDNYYSLSVYQYAEYTYTVSVGKKTELGKKMAAIAATLPGVNMNNIVGEPYFINYTVPAYTIYAGGITPNPITLNLPAGRAKTMDAAYDVILIPAGDYVLNDGENEIECSGDIGLRLAAEIGQQPETVIYDVQLLPYSPIQDESVSDSDDPEKKKISITDAPRVENVDYTFIASGESKVGFALFLSSKDMKKRLYNNISAIEKATTAMEKKVNCECNMARLVSPNYDGYFEYNPEKIGDTRYYNVYITYKPYQPYIYIAPDFNGSLYGMNYGDNRGLICGGDFSLPRATDQWLTYQLNNKNYEKTFNRQIQNMEINNKAAKISEIAGVATGTLQAGFTGSYFGGMGGAAVGALGSLGTGIMDIAINEGLRNEALDYTKDLFGYQLGNIKALPDTLTKIGAFDITNKLYPFIEYYTATDTEKEALRNKIKYNGMTIMRIGTIGDFQQTMPTYIKGKIIRLEGLMEDYHFAKTIAEEINKGVFI